MPIAKDKIKREMTTNMKANIIGKKQNIKPECFLNETKQQLPKFGTLANELTHYLPYNVLHLISSNSSRLCII